MAGHRLRSRRSGRSVPTLTLPILRRDQWEIAEHPAKVKVLAMGRRWGKTVMGGCVSLTLANAGGRAAWVSPTYRNSRPLWRWALEATANLRKRGLVRVNNAEMILEFPSGGFVGIYSGEREDALRGEWFNLVVLDEAARLSETLWTAVIQPTLADYGGDALLISTPAGKNWFWREWLEGKKRMDNTIAAFHAPSSANPNPRIRAAAALARERVPEAVYRQEWLAEFLESGGEVFRRLEEACRAEWQEQRHQGRLYVMGVDWGKFQDYTVIAVVDVLARDLVYYDRFNQIDYSLQMDRLRMLYQEFEPLVILAEANSMGEPLIEQLLADGLPVERWINTNPSKKAVIEALALDFERGEFGLPREERYNAAVKAELSSFQVVKLPSGMLRYSAPEGMHDDCVIATALAAEAARDNQGAGYAALLRGSTFYE